MTPPVLAQDAAETANADSVEAVLPEVEDPVMIRIGRDEITVRQYMTYINGSTRLVDLASSDEGRVKVLEQMAGMVLIHQAMRTEGLVAEDEFDKRTLQQAYEEIEKRHFPVPAEPDDSVLRQYYAEHPESFGIPPMVRIRHIQFKVPVNASDDRRQQARGRAEGVLERLNKGAVFADLAREVSDNKHTGAAGGDAGFMDANIPWLKQALDGIEMGGRTGIVESPAGLEIIQLTDRRDAMVMPFEQIRPEVVKLWRNDQQERAKGRYIHELAGKTEIVTVMEGIGDIEL